MMRPYPKIETLFERDNRTFRVTDKYRRPEFEIIDPWFVTEKIDGTNIRLHFTREVDCAGGGFLTTCEIGGRTAKAQIQTNLLLPLNNIIERIRSRVAKVLEQYNLESLTIYGEGYGAGIQKGGGKYRQDRSFVVFDMLVDDVAWLEQPVVIKNCTDFGLEYVPVVGVLTRREIVGYVTGSGFTSEYGDFPVEGVVARPRVELFDGRGKRVIWKLKTKDFSNAR